jgi:hypothetical protein
MTLDTQPPVIDEVKLDALGTALFRSWGIYVTDRKMIEERWLRNLRQVRKIYDPEILSMIPSDRSKAYPGVTQWMVRGTIARLMQMLWPATEKNYGIKPSPLPDLSQDQLQQVLDGLVAQKAQAQQIDPSQVRLDDVEIEKAITEFASGKAERMEIKIQDDLEEMEFITLARKVVKSAVTYNCGVAVGPLHEKVSARKWQQNPYTGKYEAVTLDKFKPLFEYLSPWDHYVDMTAVSVDKQDGTFDRHIMIRSEVEALAQREDFLSERVMKYLTDHPAGNYKAQWWESVIKGEPKSATAPVATKESRKFEALSYWGAISGHDLKAAGVDIPDDKVGSTFHANAWMLDNIVIKLKLAPFGSTIKHHHYFIFEDDDLSILGNGQCDTLRDSQLSICETARAALDNMSVIGPMVEVNMDLLTPGQDTVIKKHKTWYREGEGQAASLPAVRNINVESHLPELQSLLGMFMGFAEKESGLPAPSVGDVSGGGSEALRTSKNASMFLGAAALPIRDTVRNYDSFTISVISALVAWNQKYDPNPSRDGDHNVIARGSTSLIAKEVLSTNLNEFRASITPDEMPHLKTRAMLKARMKVNDLPVDELMEDEDVANQNIDRVQQAQEQQVQHQAELVQAQVEEALANAFMRAAQARKADSSIGVDVFEAIIKGLEAGQKARADESRNVAEHVKAGAALIAANKPTGAKAK